MDLILVYYAPTYRMLQAKLHASDSGSTILWGWKEVFAKMLTILRIRAAEEEPRGLYISPSDLLYTA